MHGPRRLRGDFYLTFKFWRLSQSCLVAWCNNSDGISNSQQNAIIKGFSIHFGAYYLPGMATFWAVKCTQNKSWDQAPVMVTGKLNIYLYVYIPNISMTLKLYCHFSQCDEIAIMLLGIWKIKHYLRRLSCRDKNDAASLLIWIQRAQRNIVSYVVSGIFTAGVQAYSTSSVIVIQKWCHPPHLTSQPPK